MNFLRLVAAVGLACQPMSVTAAVLQAVTDIGRQASPTAATNRRKFMKLQVEQLVHQCRGLFVAAVAAFAGDPAVEADFLQLGADLVPFHIALT